MVGDTYQHQLGTPKLDFKQRICLQLTGVSPMFLKSKFSKTAISSAFAVAAMVSAQSANAQSIANANLIVTATVLTACSFDLASYALPFGNITIGSTGSPQPGQVDVTVACGSSQAYTLGASGTVGARSMSGIGPIVGSSLNYELYRDAARSQPLGNVSTNWISVTGSGATHTIYGLIPQAGNNAAPAGSYTDTIQLTLTF
jgi:spore coat protein U-like protein